MISEIYLARAAVPHLVSFYTAVNVIASRIAALGTAR